MAGRQPGNSLSPHTLVGARSARHFYGTHQQAADLGKIRNATEHDSTDILISDAVRPVGS